MAPQTKLRLFADAAGYCQQPNCRKRLFSDEGGEDYHIAEMAHIFAATDGGPRPSSNLSKEALAAYENLILLCPNCHTEIDKAPDKFPDKLIQSWKSSHKETIKDTLGIAKFKSRQEVRGFIENLLLTNKVIFDQYGPNNDYKQNPEAEEAPVWRRKVLSQIIPNNQKIILAVDQNRHLANEGERKTIELFRQHLDDIIERHLGEDESQASQFPVEMNTLYLERGT